MGEILITSIDQEGTRRGFDIDLVRNISDAVNIPVIASGGMGKFSHLQSAVAEGGADAVAVAYMLHREEASVKTLKEKALAAGMDIRPVI